MFKFSIEDFIIGYQSERKGEIKWKNLELLVLCFSCNFFLWQSLEIIFNQIVLFLRVCLPALATVVQFSYVVLLACS